MLGRLVLVDPCEESQNGDESPDADEETLDLREELGETELSYGSYVMGGGDERGDETNGAGG